MSVLAHNNTPHQSKRRLWDDEAENCDRQILSGTAKRSRQHYSPPARCHFAAVGGLHVPQTTLAALLALFPGMDERTVSSVLSECGNNIDAAIRRLGELRLSAAGGQDEARQPATLAEERTGDASASGTVGGPQTAEQWIDVLVAEMSAATDMANAKERAAAFLRQFEAFVARFVKQQAASGSGSAGPSSGGGDSGAASPSTSAALAARANKLAEENAVLKKAVQIQHRQLQERAGLESEAAQLKAMLAQYQEQVRTLQVSNYSLSLHLQKATNSSALGSSLNPDVF